MVCISYQTTATDIKKDASQIEKKTEELKEKLVNTVINKERKKHPCLSKAQNIHGKPKK